MSRDAIGSGSAPSSLPLPGAAIAPALTPDAPVGQAAPTAGLVNDQNTAQGKLHPPVAGALGFLAGQLPLDTGKTWGGPSSMRDLNFGHGLDAKAELVTLGPGGAPIWGDTQTTVAPDQWVQMPAAQKQKILALLPQPQREAFKSLMDRGNPHTARIAAPNSASADAFQQRVRAAAIAATAKDAGIHGACYDTAEKTAKALGGDLDQTPDDTHARGKTLTDGLTADIASGKLKPGTAIYMNRAPGTDPRSLHPENLPHWMTYLGKDAHGTARFADQYATNWTVSEIAQHYGPRLIDAYVDPFAGKR